MDGVVLVKFRNFLHFAHHDDNGGSSPEEALLGSEVILPRGRKVGDALLEDFAVDLYLRHLEGRARLRSKGKEGDDGGDGNVIADARKVQSRKWRRCPWVPG